MSRIRLRLVACTIVVLACQAAAFSAAPFALCHGALTAADLDECCRNLAPGQTCPMHHTTHGVKSQGPRLTCVCSPSDLVIASIVGVSGALPEPIRVPDPERLPTLVATASPTTIDRQAPRQFHPPRA
jgi:hypothetical protein